MPTGDTIYFRKNAHKYITFWVWNDYFFHLHIRLKNKTDVLLSLNPFIGYRYVQGSPLQAPERSGQAILPSDKPSLYLLAPRTKLFEVQKTSCKQQKTV